MICNTCKKDYPYFTHSECKLCGFKKRNKEKYDLLISNGFWKEEEIDIILYQLLYVQPKTINEISYLLENKTLSELVSLLRIDLPVRGQTRQRVVVECSTCGKPLIETLEFYEKDRKYCGLKCRDIFRSKHFSGENSASYKKIKVKCTNCDKEYSVIPYDYNKENIYGDNHNFCSQKCYWEYRGKYYIKEKNANYGKIFSDEIKLEMSERTTKLLCDGKMPQTMTKPHCKINYILNNNNIKYTNEFNLKYQALDIYLDNYNLGIEIMGDYWHSNPNKYKIEDLNKTQLKDKKQDKRKNTYTKKYHKFEILYLWESEINKDIKLCELLINEYINKNGILQDYNSFNYYVNGNKLLLKSELVKPYFIN